MIILSFGYSKIFDLNHGGIVLSDNYDFYNYANKFNSKIQKILELDVALIYKKATYQF